MSEMDVADTNLYRGSPRQVKYWVLRALKAGLIPMVQSSPGLGKSAMIRAIAKEMNLKLVDDRISTNGPEHYSGLPDVSGEKAVYKPFDVFPLEGDPLPLDENGNEMNGWLFFLDEFNSGLPTTLVGAYKFLLEREVGQKKLHEKVFIAGAGNRDEDRAITQSLGTALQSRLIWLEMYLDGTDPRHFEEFMLDVAYPQKWPSRVISFLNYKKAYLNNFDPSHTEKTFACPRTWEFAGRLSEGFDIVLDDAPLYAGAVGANVGVEFVNYSLLSANIPTLKEVLDDPRLCRLPNDPGEVWSTTTMLIDEATTANLNDIGDYIDRLGLEFRIFFWRSIQTKRPEFRSEAAFRRNFISLSKYLYAED